MVAAKLANMPTHRPAENKSANLPTSAVSQPEAAKMLNVSERLLRDAKAVIRDARKSNRQICLFTQFPNPRRPLGVFYQDTADGFLQGAILIPGNIYKFFMYSLRQVDDNCFESHAGIKFCSRF